MTSEHFDCINSIEPYGCEKCPTFQTRTLADLKHHYKNKKRKLKARRYKCVKCQFSTYSGILLLKHKRFGNCSSKNKNESAKEVHDPSNDLANNLRSKIKLWPFWDSKRDKITPGMPQQDPKLQNADERFHKCHFCTYMGKQKEHLRRHIIMRHLVEDEIEWFHCEYCPSKFKLKHHLARHKHCHADPAVINWFKCDKCNAKFKLEEYLKRHMKSCYFKLEEVYVFKCEQCSSKYKDNRDLRKHLKLSHSKPEDIQWFQCDNCQFKTKYISSLNKHIRNQHTDPDKIQWFECDRCHFRTKHRHSFKNHLQTKHTDADKT